MARIMALGLLNLLLRFRVRLNVPDPPMVILNPLGTMAFFSLIQKGSNTLSVCSGSGCRSSTLHSNACGVYLRKAR